MKSSRAHTELQVRRALKAACIRLGGQMQFAERHGFSEQYICDVIRGYRAPADRISNALGFKRVVRYVRIGRAK